jgi:glutathione synthase/RimK-type ligase-like ATP-grasp enzyme
LGKDLSQLGTQLLQRLALNADDANALMDMSIILHLTGNRELGMSMQQQALAVQQVYRLGPDTLPAGPRLLALLSPGDLTENNVLEFLVEGSDIVLDLLYVTPNQSLPAGLPEYDVCMVAVSESDRNRPLLKHLTTMLPLLGQNPINLPERIGRSSRDGACQLLTSEPGLIMPVTARIDRATLQKIALEQVTIASVIADTDYPLIVRPVDSHKGIGLKQLTTPADILHYLTTQSAEDFYISRYIDYRSKDGLFRKYRIVFIDGKAFVCHMAISENWMVHYMSAGMTDSPLKKAEEAQFMQRFDDAFACKHEHAFNSIVQKMGLEYVGIDCGETAAGELLIFEIDSSMTIHAMDPIETFPYKHIQLGKVFNAFRGMLLHKMQSMTNDK